MSRYQCLPCGYIYDEDELEKHTAPSFEDEPFGWVCPECGSGKQDFELIEDN